MVGCFWHLRCRVAVEMGNVIPGNLRDKPNVSSVIVGIGVCVCVCDCVSCE